MRRQYLGNLDEIRPQRRYHDDAIARRHERFDGQHQRRHSGRRDRDRFGIDGSVQPRDVGADGLTQLGDAEVVRVERFAARERCGRLIANERRRDFIGLAEPERQQVTIADTGVGDFAYLRSAQ